MMFTCHAVNNSNILFKQSASSKQKLFVNKGIISRSLSFRFGMPVKRFEIFLQRNISINFTKLQGAVCLNIKICK